MERVSVIVKNYPFMLKILWKTFNAWLLQPIHVVLMLNSLLKCYDPRWGEIKGFTQAANDKILTGECTE